MAIEARDLDVSGPAPGHPAKAATITAINKANAGLKKRFDINNLSSLNKRQLRIAVNS
jgi:hypothetical protein